MNPNLSTLPFQPVFVTGCMRSGTTLLQRLVSTSPDAGALLSPSRYIADQLTLYARYRRASRFMVEDYFPDIAGFDALTRELLVGALRSAWENSGRPKALIVKSTDFSGHVPLLANLLPEAKIVVSMRDPKDTISSMLKVGERQRRLNIRSPIVQAHRDMKRLCKFYNGAYLSTLRAKRWNRALASEVLFVRYEDIVSDTAKALAPVWTHCGIAPGGSDLPKPIPAGGGLAKVGTHRFWQTYVTDLTARPVSKDSLGGHKKTLSAAEARAIEWRCRYVRRTFGYA